MLSGCAGIGKGKHETVVCYHPEVDSFPITGHEVFYSSYTAAVTVFDRLMNSSS